ncbi:MAG: DNA-binding protein [Ignavibacteria bacterium]|nr:DNA-binding protein [Ignavibacteria bacterium]
MPLQANEKILLIDTNSYFRLAQSIHPLLNVYFGDERYIILILKELESEYKKSSNLQNKFPWVYEAEFVENRKHVLKISKTNVGAIFEYIKYIRLFSRENYLTVSEVDIKYLATALEFGYILVTDDSDMLKVASEFDITIMNSLGLLKCMLDCNYISLEKIKEITSYWLYNKDTPKDFREDCKSIFNIHY